jgi:hypothetical protein
MPAAMWDDGPDFDSMRMDIAPDADTLACRDGPAAEAGKT